MDDLPRNFDVIIVGTGLTESIVSAAVARVGHSVLHLDPRDYYGGKWGTMCWNTWTSGTFAQSPSALHNVLGTFERNHVLTTIVWRNDVRDFEELWYTDKKNLIDEVNSLSRRFNVDILPKVLMAREETIQLLIHSNVSRYLQFSCIKRLMSSLPPPNEKTIEPIPLSRSDIFTSKAISLIEKRKLMKFIEYVLKSEEGTSNNSSSGTTPHDETSGRKTFVELAKMHNLSPKIQHLIHSAVRTMDDCMESSDTGDEGQDNFNLKFTQNCRLFLQSINRYGNQTPFLWTLYGISEICQSFCRLSAIYGGTFILNRSIESISEIQEEIESTINVRIPDLTIKCKYLVLGPEFKMETECRSKSPKCRQGITLVRGTLLISGDEPLLASNHQVPVVDNNEPGGSSTVYRFGDMDVIELDETSLAVPKNYRLLQVTIPYREGNPSPREIIETRLESFVNFHPSLPSVSSSASAFGTKNVTSSNPSSESIEIDIPRPSSSSSSSPTSASSHPMTNPEPEHHKAEDRNSKPTVVHGAYFLIDFYDDIKDQDIQNPRILSCATSSTELTDHVEKAREMFSRMFPTEEFLPKAPDAPEYGQEDELEEDMELGGIGMEPHARGGREAPPPPHVAVPPEEIDGHGPQDMMIANHFDDNPQMDYIQNGVVDGE